MRDLHSNDVATAAYLAHGEGEPDDRPSPEEVGDLGPGKPWQPPVGAVKTGDWTYIYRSSRPDCDACGGSGVERGELCPQCL